MTGRRKVLGSPRINLLAHGATAVAEWVADRLNHAGRGALAIEESGKPIILRSDSPADLDEAVAHPGFIGVYCRDVRIEHVEDDLIDWMRQRIQCNVENAG